jgi:hypothetical protein
MRPLLPWLLLAGALSIAAMVFGAGRGDQFNPALAAGLFSAAAIAAALWINAPLWFPRPPGADRSRIKVALACNIWLAALIYAWGAIALFAVYSLSDLVWRHSWQYGLGAGLFAVGVSYYANRMDQAADDVPLPSLYLTALHGFTAAGGLLYLIVTGKLATHKGDWAANDVFLAGGIAVVTLCVITAITQIRVSTRQS